MIEKVLKITTDKKNKQGKKKYIKKEERVEEEEEEVEEEEGSVSIYSEADDIIRSCHRLPDASSLDDERTLQRIATTGGRRDEIILLFSNPLFIYLASV